jgi:hypothetical protein
MLVDTRGGAQPTTPKSTPREVAVRMGCLDYWGQESVKRPNHVETAGVGIPCL